MLKIQQICQNILENTINKGELMKKRHTLKAMTFFM